MKINKLNEERNSHLLVCFVDVYDFGCHSGKFCIAAIICNTINFNAGARCQVATDLSVTVVGETKRKHGWPRKKDVPTVWSTQPVSQSSAVTVIEEYVPTSLTSQQASILNAASLNFNHPQSSAQYSLMGMPPFGLFSACPNVCVKRRLVTPEQKQRQLELAWARKKRF